MMDQPKFLVFARQFEGFNALLPRNQPTKTAFGMVMHHFHGPKKMNFHCAADIAYF